MKKAHGISCFGMPLSWMRKVFQQGMKGRKSVLLVPDVRAFARIEGKVADRGDEAIDAKGEDAKTDISPGAGSPAIRFEGRMVDDEAPDEAEEEGEEEASEVVVHGWTPFLFVLG